MGLQFREAPAEGRTTLARGLDEMKRAFETPHRLERMGIAMATPESVRSPQAQWAKPIPVYQFSLTDVAAGLSLDSAKLASWTYFMVQGDAVIEAATVRVAEGGDLVFAGTATGGVRESAETLAHAEGLPEIAQGSFEIRILFIPALFIRTLWLKDLHGDGDRFLVMDRAFPPLQAKTPYAWNQLLPMLIEMKSRRTR